MSIEAIKQELAGLDVASRHEIIAYLVSIEDRNNAEYRASLTRKIDDRNSDHWLTLEEMDRKLGVTDDEKKA